MTWLTSLPTGVLVAGCLTLAFVVTAASRVVIRAVVPTDERDHVHAIAAPLMPALGATFAVLMALTLSSEAGYLRSAQDIVSNEAAQASRLAWASTSAGVETGPIQGALDATTSGRPGPTNGRSRAAPSARTPPPRALVARLERTVRAEAARPALGTPTSTELLASLDTLTTTRRERLAAASRELPALYVLTLVASGLALVVNAGALTTRSSARTSLLVGGLAVVVASQPGVAVRAQCAVGRSAHRERRSDRRGRSRPGRRVLPRLSGARYSALPLASHGSFMCRWPTLSSWSMIFSVRSISSGRSPPTTAVERVVEELQEQQHRHDHRDDGPHEHPLDDRAFAHCRRRRTCRRRSPPR